MDSLDMTERMKQEEIKRRRRDWALSAEERMAKFLLLQAQAEELLRSNPTALADFHRRNRQKRTAAKVREFELRTRLLKPQDSQI